MAMTNAVVGSEQPSLEILESDVDHRKMGFNSFWVSINHQRFMHVTQCLQIIIARPAVGVHDGSFRHILPHKLR